jgi:hypothetical protein
LEKVENWPLPTLDFNNAVDQTIKLSLIILNLNLNLNLNSMKFVISIDDKAL